MKNNAVEQNSEELNNLKESMERLERKVDTIDKDEDPLSLLWDIIKSYLIGVFIVGPVIAVVVIAFYVLNNWLTGWS